MYNNPFQNVPSASKMYRISNCPASFKMELHAKDYSSTKDADKGNEVHGILAGESEGESPHDAELTAEMCEDQCCSLLDDWHGGDDTADVHKERRYALTRLGGVVEATADTKADVIFTGQFDRLYISGSRGLLIDFKALHGNHPHALENPQLASLSVPVSIKHKLQDLRVAIVQPWKGKPTTADYDSFMLSQARDWLGRVLEKERAATPDDRNAGEWCKNCAARFGCDTFQSANIAALDVIKPETIAGDSKHQASVIFARMAELSIPQLVHIQQNVRQMMGVFLASHAAVFKAKVGAGEVPGWTIKTSPGNRDINDAQKAFAALEPLGITAEAALAACSMSIGPLEDAVRKASGIKSQTEKRTVYNLTADQAKKALNVALEGAGAISRKADKSELVPVAITD
jgi:hypothetical protein